jgi:hypothetical protein
MNHFAEICRHRLHLLTRADTIPKSMTQGTGGSASNSKGPGQTNTKVEGRNRKQTTEYHPSKVRFVPRVKRKDNWAGKPPMI